MTLLMKCTISKGSFSGERYIKFKVGSLVWHTISSSRMCYDKDLKVADEIQTEEDYEGWVEILKWGKKDDKYGWVRFWFTHDTEVMENIPLKSSRRRSGIGQALFAQGDLYVDD